MLIQNVTCIIQHPAHITSSAPVWWHKLLPSSHKLWEQCWMVWRGDSFILSSPCCSQWIPPCTFASHAQALVGAVIHFRIAVWTSCSRSDCFIYPHRPVPPDSQLLFSSKIRLMYKSDIWHFLLTHNSRDCCSKIRARLEGAKEIHTLYAEELWDGQEIPGGASGRGSWISLFWNQI